MAALLAAAPVGLAGEAPPRLEAWTGGATPALAGPGLAGAPHDLAALRGRAVLVAFWASWCEPCEAELPALAALPARLAGRPFALLTVNLGEGPARVGRFLAARAPGLPVLLDRDRAAGAAWGVDGLPMAFLVDATGRVRGRLFGAADWTSGEPGAALERLVAEAEASPARAGGAGRP